MSIATVKTIATRFLTSKTPEVLALTGAWGVGKTFLWDQLVQQHKNEIKLASYSYVSLFGISSINELRTAIFVKTKSVKFLGKEFNAVTENAGLEKLLREGWKPVVDKLSKLKNIPWVGNSVSVALETLASHLVEDTIICLDDFERLDQGRVTVDQILGIITELKVEKKCKIVLIFNEDKLKAQETYKKYQEKVVDIALEFAPTTEESTEIALPPGMPCREAAKKYATSLNITNIRVLSKIANLIVMINNEVGSLHPGVMEQAVNTLILLVWCHYDSNEKKPTMEFIIGWNRMALGFKHNGEVEDPKHKEWKKTLQNYGLLQMDGFDRTIYKVIQRGYLEETGFSEEAIKLDAQIRANELEQTFSAAWKLFHNTFADNQTELIQAWDESVRKAIRHINLPNLNSTVRLIRQFGQSEVADKLIDYYISAHADEHKLFNLAEDPFSGEIDDPVIWERFNKKYAEIYSVLPLIDAVKHIATNNSWSKEHTDALKRATKEDFYELFKLEHGEYLNAIVKSCLQFEDWEDDKKSIGQAARAALVRIGKESPLNAIRVRRYGITI